MKPKNLNKYSITVGVISISAEAQKPLSTLRKTVINDIVYLTIEIEKIKALADTYIEDDDGSDEPEDHFPYRKKRKPEPELNYYQ